jgi:hypothetical protein
MPIHNSNISENFIKFPGLLDIEGPTIDAHNTDNLDDMRIGTGQARRGWLEAKNVLNTRSFTELKKMLKRT